MNIGFVGGIRYFEINKRLIDDFSNSPRFNLYYVGRKHPGCDLQEYCTARGVHNVFFLPAYLNEEKANIYLNIDIINSVYGDNTAEVRTLLPHRLYDCAIYKKPIFVSKNTYLYKIVAQYNLGLAVDLKKENAKNIITAYLECFDEELFKKGCDEFLKHALPEKDNALKCVDKFIKTMIRGIK